MLLFAESICRIFFLLSPWVSLHLDGFGRVLCSGLERGIWSGLVGCFVQVWNGRTTARGKKGFSRQIDLHTQVYGATSAEISINLRHQAEAWPMCGRYLRRPSHLQIAGRPKMAHAELSRWAIDGPRVSK